MNRPDQVGFMPAALLAITAALLSAIPPVHAGTNDGSTELAEMSLEELISLDVTSVSKRAEKVSTAAAAVHVITAEEIRRTGATSIPEALRMVPGLQVAQIDANTWAVSARGFNSEFANKLLVLIDGRSVYTPLFSGVYWNHHDIPMEDIERIEIIRGPGATLWGANAVNGVINVITRHTEETEGSYALVGGGSEETMFGVFRHGTEIAQDMWFRAYGKYKDWEHSTAIDGAPVLDAMDNRRAGFRLDYEGSLDNSLTIEGDLYETNSGESYPIAIETFPFTSAVETEMKATGGHLLARWQHFLRDESGITIQSYFDRVSRSDEIHEYTRTTLDLEVQHDFQVFNRVETVWGGGVRSIDDEYTTKSQVTLEPAVHSGELYNAFLMSRVPWHDNRFLFTVGGKVEHNEYTGLEWQPSTRLQWLPSPRHSIWGAASRAVRSPSRMEIGGRYPIETLPPFTGDNVGPLAVLINFTGSEDLQSENLTAYEIGYRLQPASTVSIDVSAFYNEYDDLFATIRGVPQLDGGVVKLALRATNEMSGRTRGAETSFNWYPSRYFHLNAYYAYLEVDVDRKSSGVETDQLDTIEESDPEHQASLRTSLQITPSLDLSLWGRYVDRVEHFDFDSYLTMDARIGWRLLPDVELSLKGRDIFESGRSEYVSILSPTTSQVKRSFYAALNLTY